MQLYSHIVDLRISHPELDPSAVTRTLGMEPQHAWRAGDPRKTTKGTLLAGTHATGYWRPIRFPMVGVTPPTPWLRTHWTSC